MVNDGETNNKPPGRTEGMWSYNDGDRRKKVPNSLRAIVRAIRKWWDNKGVKDRNLDEFAVLFEPCYSEISGHYKGNKINTGVSGVVERLEGTGDIKFHEIRAISHYVGLPSGLLLLYSQCLGDAIRGEKADGNPHVAREYVLNLLRSSQVALGAAADFLEAQSSTGDAMFEVLIRNSDSLAYAAKLEPLRVMADAFKTVRRAPPGSR